MVENRKLFDKSLTYRRRFDTTGWMFIQAYCKCLSQAYGLPITQQCMALAQPGFDTYESLNE